MQRLGLVFCLLLVSCGDEENSGGNGTHELKLEFTQVAENTYQFEEFDNVFGTTGGPNTAEITGGTFYQGTLSAHDGAKVRVYAVIVPNASIDRILVTVNGGTGTDPRFFLKHYDHKALVMVDMRGLHLEENIKNGECALGGGAVECLKKVPWLKQVNPRDNGIDIVSVMRIINGEAGSFTVDGETRDRSFFVAEETPFNFNTGSYGATIFAYALAQPNLPALGRVFIDGPSSPSEYVISDGFRNLNVALNNLLDAVGMDSTEKTGFLDAMKARHDSFHNDCSYNSENPPMPTKDCLSSAMLYSYLTDAYVEIADGDASQASTKLATLKGELVAITAAEITGASLSAVKTIYDELGGGVTRWEDYNLDFTSSDSQIIPDGFKSPGFTSRIGQICSAYINRHDGDSLSRFNAEKAKTSNDPYWYGFLIRYRTFLDLCPEIAGNLTTGIKVPSGVAVSVEAFVQYGAGIDEKHHQVDIDEMASYIASGVKVQAMVDNQVQGGSGPDSNSGCREALEAATFNTATADLATELASIKSNDCGL